MGGLKNISRVVLFFILLITGILGYNVSKVEFNYDFEEFFPTDDPETKFFEEHRHRFESDNDFVFIAFQNEPNVFDFQFLMFDLHSRTQFYLSLSISICDFLVCNSIKKYWNVNFFWTQFKSIEIECESLLLFSNAIFSSLDISDVHFAVMI